MKKYIIYALFSVIMLAGGCAEDEIKRYATEDSAVYFDKRSYSFSFYYDRDKSEMTVSVPVTIIGTVADFDRTIGVTFGIVNVVAPTGSYRIVSAGVAAGAMKGTVEVELKKTPELAAGAVHQIELALTESDDFRVGYTDKLTTTIVWDGWMPMPGFWTYTTGYGYTPGDYISYVYGDDGAKQTGVFSTALGEFILLVWGSFDININGWMGSDDLENYPIVPITGATGATLINDLQKALEALPEPLYHSDDAFMVDRYGNRTSVTGNPLIRLNTYNLKTP